MGDAEFVGIRTGRVWRYHVARPIAFNRWQATADDGSQAMLVRREKQAPWLEEIEWMRRAIEVAMVPEVADSSAVRLLLDLREADTEVMNIGGDDMPFPGHLSTAWEWGDITLHDFLSHPHADRAAVVSKVEANVKEALTVLHSVGFIHCDVAPNNIFRVEGAWKLGDLDACRRAGEQANRFPKKELYLHPDRRTTPAPLAREEFDWYALDAVLNELRG